MPQLLREYYELCEGGVCKDLLNEEEKRYVANGGMILSGKLQESDVQNGNGRVYPHKILEREMKNYTKLVKEIVITATKQTVPRVTAIIFVRAIEKPFSQGEWT